MQKKRNFFQKLWLKINNPLQYCYEYEGLTKIIENKQIEANNIARLHSDEYIKNFVQKFTRESEENTNKIIENIVKKWESQIPHFPEKSFEDLSQEFNAKISNIKKSQEILNFKHSGHLGDLIYSLPTAISLSENRQNSFNFFVDIKKKSVYKDNQEHFGGGKMLNEKTFTMLKPLLEQQSYIKSVGIFDENTNDTNSNMDYNLDIFRELPIFLNRGNIAKWYSYAFGAYFDLSNAWISVIPNKQYQENIILARSQRYNNPHIDYTFLSKYENIIFLGVENEYQTMKKKIPNLIFKEVNNFLEMAQIIAGCKFFIGNQSFPYALAEALKVPRLLEIFYQNPNVIPNGNNGYDFYFQYHFENLVKKLNISNS